MQNHNERTYNAIGGYGYITNAEVRQITAQVWVIDPETNERVPAGSAVWAEEGAWYERGVLGQIGLGLRGFADEASMGLVSLIERSQGRLDVHGENVITGKDFSWAVFVDHEGALHVSGPKELMQKLST